MQKKENTQHIIDKPYFSSQILAKENREQPQFFFFFFRSSDISQITKLQKYTIYPVSHSLLFFCADGGGEVDASIIYYLVLFWYYVPCKKISNISHVVLCSLSIKHFIYNAIHKTVLINTGKRKKKRAQRTKKRGISFICLFIHIHCYVCTMCHT
jgi:hypothetical protein